MALDSVTSSGRDPSMSLMDGSAPAFSKSSTMSANSHADAMKKKWYELGGKVCSKHRIQQRTNSKRVQNFLQGSLLKSQHKMKCLNYWMDYYSVAHTITIFRELSLLT